MYAELHDGLKNVQVVPTTRVVVYDDYDNPIAVVVQVDNNRYVAFTAAHKQFKQLLNTMGITRTLIIEEIDPKKLPPLE